jgi:uncharacterized oxidoreductase
MSFLNSTEAQKSTVLITGGASGIGLALAERFMALGHTVIATGRRQTVLDAAVVSNPLLKIIQSDISSDAGRIALFERVIKEFPEVNVLINNAGIVNPNNPLLKDTTPSDWEEHKAVYETNLIAPTHLSILFTPHFITKPHALIANNTSVLAFFPYAGVSSYSGSKGNAKTFSITIFCINFYSCSLQPLSTPSRSLFATS